MDTARSLFARAQGNSDKSHFILGKFSILIACVELLIELELVLRFSSWN